MIPSRYLCCCWLGSVHLRRNSVGVDINSFGSHIRWQGLWQMLADARMLSRCKYITPLTHSLHKSPVCSVKIVANKHWHQRSTVLWRRAVPGKLRSQPTFRSGKHLFKSAKHQSKRQFARESGKQPTSALLERPPAGPPLAPPDKTGLRCHPASCCTLPHTGWYSFGPSTACSCTSANMTSGPKQMQFLTPSRCVDKGQPNADTIATHE